MIESHQSSEREEKSVSDDAPFSSVLVDEVTWKKNGPTWNLT